MLHRRINKTAIICRTISKTTQTTRGEWSHGPRPALPTFRVMGQVSLQKFPFPIGPRPASALLCAGLLQGTGRQLPTRVAAPKAGGAPKDKGGTAKDEGWVPQGWGRGVPKVGEEGVNRDQGGQTYPGAHEGNLLVVEAVHGAGEAGSAPGPLSIDAGPGRGGPARAPAGARLGGGGDGEGEGSDPGPCHPRGWLGAGAGPPRLPGEPARSCRGGSQPPGS